MRKIKIHHWSMDTLLLIFCFFPFIGPIKGVDSQPIALIFAVILLLLKGSIRIVHKNEFMLCTLIMLLTLLASFCTQNETYDIVKRCYSYVCVLLVPVAFYNSKIDINSPRYENLVKRCMLVWFFVGIIQTFIKKDFLTFLIAAMRTDISRGCTSLANEPSFYGYMSFFFFLLSLEFKKNRTLFVCINLIQVFLLAQSAVSSLYFVVFFSLILMSYLKKFTAQSIAKFLLITLLIVIGTVLLLKYLAATRIGIVLSSLLSNPQMLLSRDGSVSSRWYSMTSSFNAFPYPNFMGTATIMSGYGGLFFDLGILALVYIVYFFRLMAWPIRGGGRTS